MKVNGWRRLGIVLVSIWFLVCASLAGLEVWYAKPLLFGYSGPPDGTEVDTGKGTIKLPNGKVVQMWQNAGESFSKPWEITWSDYPDVPITTRVDWPHFAAVALLMPLALWLLAEVAVLAVAWIRAGFTAAPRG